MLEIMFRKNMAQKRMNSAPPLPPLEERERRIRDTYASKKRNEAGRKRRELVERRIEEARASSWK